MKRNAIFGFAFDSIVRRKYKFILELFIMFICLFMLTIGLFMNKQSLYYRTSLNSVFKKGIQDIGILINNDNSSGEWKEDFFYEAINSGYVEAIGTYGMGGTDILPELAKMQGKYSKDSSYGQNLEMHYMNATLLPLCDIELSEGTWLYDTRGRGAYWHGLYLGSEFSDIPVGTIYTYEMQDATAVFEVLGILGENAKWVDTSVMSSGYAGTTKGYNSMNEAVICIYNGDIMDSVGLFSVGQGFSFEETKEYLQNLASDYGLKMTVGSLETEIEQSEHASASIQSIFLKIFYLLGVTSVICILCFQMITLLSRTNEYGVLYANGAGKRDVLGITIVEMTIQYILAFIISVTASYYFIQSFFAEGDISAEIMRILLFKQVYAYVFIVGASIMVISGIIPLVYIARRTPSELINFNKG